MTALPVLSYDAAAFALAPDASDVRDIAIDVGDTVCVQRPHHRAFYGCVEALDAAAGCVTVWNAKLCSGGTFDAEYVCVVVKRTALEADEATASA